MIKISDIDQIPPFSNSEFNKYIIVGHFIDRNKRSQYSQYISFIYRGRSGFRHVGFSCSFPDRKLMTWGRSNIHDYAEFIADTIRDYSSDYEVIVYVLENLNEVDKFIRDYKIENFEFIEELKSKWIQEKRNLNARHKFEI